jgi:hypothetical protein
MRLLGYQRFENCRRKFYRAVVQPGPFARKRYLHRKCSQARSAINYGMDVVTRYNRLFPKT